jgi:hypothetical protein
VERVVKVGEMDGDGRGWVGVVHLKLEQMESRVGGEACLNDWVIVGKGIEVIIEHRFADDVQGEAREEVFHLHALS